MQSVLQRQFVEMSAHLVQHRFNLVARLVRKIETECSDVNLARAGQHLAQRRPALLGAMHALGAESLSPEAQLIEVPFATSLDNPDKAPTYEGRPPKTESH